MSPEYKAVSVGRVVGLWRYPVKSMAAEPLDDTSVSWHGLQGDRRWAFVRNNSVKNGFPWFTLRQRSDMNRYVPTFADPSKPDVSTIHVTTPMGEIFEVDNPALGLALCEEGAQVIKQNRGVFDTFPISLISSQTISALGEMVDKNLDVLRFRPNILIEANTDAPFTEDDWVGKTIKIGGLRMRVDQRDARCVVITMDPATGERNPEILRTVADQRQQCLGVYGSTVEPGNVAVGDSVELESPIV